MARQYSAVAGVVSFAMLYIGPDQVAPLTSILAAAGGAILLFWRQVKGVFLRVMSIFRRK